jgi:hypothetical protein
MDDSAVASDRAIQSRGTGVCGDKRSLAVSQLFR